MQRKTDGANPLLRGPHMYAVHLREAGDRETAQQCHKYREHRFLSLPRHASAGLESTDTLTDRDRGSDL